MSLSMAFATTSQLENSVSALASAYESQRYERKKCKLPHLLLSMWDVHASSVALVQATIQVSDTVSAGN